jgi:hypothetical protein
MKRGKAKEKEAGSGGTTNSDVPHACQQPNAREEKKRERRDDEETATTTTKTTTRCKCCFKR